MEPGNVFNAVHSGGGSLFTHCEYVNIVRPSSRRVPIKAAVKLFLISIVMLQYTAIRGVWGQKAECVEIRKTSACDDGHPRWEALNYGEWDGMDCLIRDIVQGLVRLKQEGFVEWVDICAELPLDQQGGDGPIMYKDVTVDGYDCTLNNKTRVFVMNETEVDYAVKHGATACTPTSVDTKEELSPCTSDGVVDVCSRGEFDWQILDAVARPDCTARALRDVFGHYKGSPPASFLPHCEKDRRLPYTANCPGTNVYRSQAYVENYQNDCQSTWHWHVHGNNDGIRGLTYSPLLTTLGSKPCFTTSCTVQQGQSCWPRPYFSSGFRWGTVLEKIYSCTTANDIDWHFSGNFRGVLYVYGDLSYGGSGGCTATELDGRIKISAPTMSWCDIWTDEPIGQTLVAESTAGRNVCSGS